MITKKTMKKTKNKYIYIYKKTKKTIIKQIPIQKNKIK